jgi:predicted ATPase
LKREGIVFTDRGLGDTLAYCRVRKLKVSKEMLDYTKKFKYAGVFVLDFLDNYVRDTLRQESKEEQEKIHEMIIETYKELGYKPIIVPFMSVEERVRFILSKINNSDKK